MYGTYDKLQTYFGQENLHLHYMDTDSFVLSVNTKVNLRLKKSGRHIWFQKFEGESWNNQ